MTYAFRSTTCSLALLSSSLTGLAEIQSANLRCEYLKDPVGIDVTQPRFSWQLDDTRQSRGLEQSAYHILVASSPQQLSANRADLWDSGRVMTDQSQLVSYAGKTLDSGQQCYWKVKTWTTDSESTPQATSWSEPSRFTIGLLDASDWTGPWITHRKDPQTKLAIPNRQHLWFRRNLELDQSPSSAFIHVASIGYHELHVNGEKVDDRVLAPALTRLDKRAHYVTYDIASLLKPGTNAIGIHYGPGWSRYNFFKAPQTIRVQLNATMPDGKPLSLASDNQWRCSVAASQNIGGCQYGNNGGELIDGRLIIPGWNQPGFDDSSWAVAEEIDVNVILSAQMMPPSRIIATIPAIKLVHQGKTKDGQNIHRVVMEKNYTGFFEMKLRGQQSGDLISIEAFDDPKCNDGLLQKLVYFCHGKGEETFSHRFNFCAGGYFTITGLRQQPRLSDFTGHAVSTDLPRIGDFKCSNELFNQIYETDIWTFMANTTEGYTSDCPHRERLGYGEVQFATAWGITLPNFDAGAYLSKYVRDWVDVQEENGWIHHTAPQINKHYGGPMWSSAGFNMTSEFYLHHGDRRILELNHGSARRWLEFLNQNVRDGLLRNFKKHRGRFLGDWAAPEGRKEFGDTPEAEYFNNCVYAMNLSDFIRKARILGKEKDATLYQQRLDPLRKQIHQTYFNPDTGLYSSGTQVQQAFAILTEVCPPDYRKQLDAKIAASIRKLSYLDMGSSGLPVLLKFMIEQSEHTEILDIPLNRTIIPSYGFFLKFGETTWPEYWEPRKSNIHTCYTGISSWFTKAIAGIRPDPQHPGFQQFLIDPVLAGDLTHASARTQSPYGTIISEWKRERDKITFHVQIPPNSSATVSLPAKQADVILENGKPLQHSVGVTVIDTTGANTHLKVLSGHYRFTVPR